MKKETNPAATRELILRWSVTLTNGAEVRGAQKLNPGENTILAELPDGILSSVKASVKMPVTEDTRIFLNGYQSWTNCPEKNKREVERGLRHLPRVGVDRFSLDRYADYHFITYPLRRGYWHGFSCCYFRDQETVRFLGSTDERPGYTIFFCSAYEELLTIRRDCSGMKCGGTFHVFDLYYAVGAMEEVFDGWFAAIGKPCLAKEKIAGYSSWYNRYQDISEQTIGEDLAGAKNVLKAGDMFQIDDGWEPFVGDWLEADTGKFPGGMKTAADAIHADGFRAGLWLAPFVAEEKSALYREHQDWFLKVRCNREGIPENMIPIGDPARDSREVYEGRRKGDNHPLVQNWKAGCNWSGYYALDIDHPEVISYLTSVFRRVFDEWGYDLVKLDFLYAAAPYGTEEESRAGRMIRAMELLRRLCGDKLILGCGVPLMPAFGLVDYCRVSCDVTLDWDDKPHMRLIHRERPSTKHAIETDTARYPFNMRAFGNDPDVFFLRTQNLQLTEGQKKALAETCAAKGSVFFTSDNMADYNEAQLAEYRRLRELFENGGVK